MKVPLNEIQLGKNYSRTFGVGDVTELAESMQEHGQITPVILDDHGNLIAGYRRYHAAQSLGWHEIEAMVRAGDDAQKSKVVNLLENMQRTELTLWEEIQAIRDVFGIEASQSEIARQLSKSRPWVEPRVKVWEMPQDFIDRVRLGVAGIQEIRKRLRARTGKDTATSKREGTPKQDEIKETITQLVAAGREAEAKALSYAIGGISREELFA